MYRQILEDEPNHPMALHLLGALALQGDDHELAIDLITQAVKVQAKFPEAYNNLAGAYRGLKQYTDAIKNYQNAISVKGDFIDAYRNLAATYKELGRIGDVADTYRDAVDRNPNVIEIQFEYIDALVENGDIGLAKVNCRSLLERRPELSAAHFRLAKIEFDSSSLQAAIDSYLTGLKLSPNNAGARCNLGLSYELQGRLDDALQCYRDAITYGPNLVEPYFNLGSVLQRQNKLDEAKRHYEKVLELQPTYTQALSNLGVIHRENGQIEDAIICFKQAIETNQHHYDAHDNLCDIMEKTNQIKRLREVVEAAKNLCSPSPKLKLREAQLLVREGDWQAALSGFEGQPELDGDPAYNSARAFVLGQIYDRLGYSDLAYSHFEKGNSAQRLVHLKKGIQAETYLEHIKHLTSQFTSDWVSSWRPVSEQPDRPAPIFLAGFPRSGTTLLDTILLSHKMVRVTEESPAVQFMWRAAKQQLGACPGGLAEIDEDQLSVIRQVYYAALDRQLGEVDKTSLIIDKMPLHLADAGFIHRIFPNAKFLFVQRHPYDCVLSCFMQNFESNSAMANFVSLEGSANLYDKVMNVWLQYQSILPLSVTAVRYEDLVESFEETLEPVLTFLGLDWEDGLKDYAATAHKRKIIKTASYSQVTQPLYKNAQNRWKKYDKQMAAVKPILGPWAVEFGYET